MLLAVLEWLRTLYLLAAMRIAWGEPWGRMALILGGVVLSVLTGLLALVVIGFASGPIPEIPLNLTLLKGCSIVGVFWGRFTAEEPQTHLQNIKELWEMFAEGRLKPAINDVFPLENYEEAYAVMTERRASGKVILTT